VTTGGIAVRPERPEDHAAIRRVNTDAFGRPNEAWLVDALRRTAGFVPELSLVAESGGEVVGHVLLSQILIREGSETVSALALAPMAVLPSHQRRGVGSALVLHALTEARRLGHGVVVVLGHASYYPRFGFAPASQHGIRSPFPVRDESFMVLELAPAALAGVMGEVEYPPEFGQFDSSRR
jgi:putative acetyltransferase